MYHAGNHTRIEAETKLSKLRQRVATWLPNFTKYEDKDVFADGLMFITPETIVNETMRQNIWETMRERTSFDSMSDMWGFSQGENP